MTASSPPSRSPERWAAPIHGAKRNAAGIRSVDASGPTSVPGILVAGDGAGIGGAAAAVLSGRIAALGAAPAGDMLLGRRCCVPNGRGVWRCGRCWMRCSPPRPMRLDDATLVCRCEEVTAGAIRQAARAGCQGMNQLRPTHAAAWDPARAACAAPSRSRCWPRRAASRSPRSNRCAPASRPSRSRVGDLATLTCRSWHNAASGKQCGEQEKETPP